MDAPQSSNEVQPVVAALRRLDGRLDVVWNPRALIVRHGAIDVYGTVIQPTHDGRWEVVIRDTAAGMHADRDYAVVYQVRGPEDEYKAVGPWLVEFMQKWDSAQAHFREEMARAWAMNDLNEANAARVDDAAVEDRMDRIAFASNYRGGVETWKGRGADFGAMAAKARRAMAPPNGQPALIPK